MSLLVRSFAFAVYFVLVAMAAPQAPAQQDRLSTLEAFIQTTRTSFAAWKDAWLCDKPGLQRAVEQCRAQMDHATTLIKSPRREELAKVEAIAAEASKLQKEGGQALPTWGRCRSEAVDLHGCLAGFALKMVTLKGATRGAPAD
jgi:hypothetical protein